MLQKIIIIVFLICNVSLHAIALKSIFDEDYEEYFLISKRQDYLYVNGAFAMSKILIKIKMNSLVLLSKYIRKLISKKLNYLPYSIIPIEEKSSKDDLKFNRTAQYLDQKELELCQVRNVHGNLQCSLGLPDNKYLYVISPDEKLYVMNRNMSRMLGKRYFCHSCFLSGGDVLGAGELKINDNKIEYINNSSGHYKPDFYRLLQSIFVLYYNNIIDLTRYITFDFLSEANVTYHMKIKKNRLYLKKDKSLLIFELNYTALLSGNIKKAS